MFVAKFSAQFGTKSHRAVCHWRGAEHARQLVLLPLAWRGFVWLNLAFSCNSSSSSISSDRPIDWLLLLLQWVKRFWASANTFTLVHFLSTEIVSSSLLISSRVVGWLVGWLFSSPLPTYQARPGRWLLKSSCRFHFYSVLLNHKWLWDP